jgi:sugar phosphate isomerase/epimerase
MNRKFGFTTMTFKPVLLAGGVSLQGLFEWGAERGFDWVEVRDFDLSFSEADLLKVKSDAERCGLRVHYAWDGTSIYPAEDLERIFGGIRNASLFGEGTCSRIVIAPELICAAEGKMNYSAQESDQIITHLGEIVRYASRHGVILVFENSLETVGGFEFLLDAVPEMRMTLDTANTFNADNTGESLEWPRFKEFICRRKEQIPYVHLKSSVAGETVPDLLEGGDVPLAGLLSLLDANGWLCVELPADDRLSSCLARLESGLKLMRHLCTSCL